MLALPPLNLEHLGRLTDDRGIIQHAVYSVPNRKTGYCTDDNSRALVVAARRYTATGDNNMQRLAGIYLSFMLYAQRADGYFRNFIGYDMSYLDEGGSEDCLGRAAWACGVAMASDLPASMRHCARHMFDRAARHFQEVVSPRARASVLRGIYHMTGGKPHGELARQARAHAEALREFYRQESAPGWHWYQAYLTYANASLPEAMFLASSMLGEPAYARVAEESLDFLTEVLFPEGVLMPVGTNGWYSRDRERAVFDQQPEEAEALVRCAEAAWNHSGHPRYWELAQRALGWFLGENVHGVPMYDPTTGGCFDGITSEGVNQNQGAESTLAYLASHLTVEAWGNRIHTEIAADGAGQQRGDDRPGGGPVPGAGH